MIHPILRRYWPSESQTLLLIVALGEPEAAAVAWRKWIARNSLDDASWAEVRLLASAARRLREIDPASPWLRRLEGVRRFVWSNTQISLKAAEPLLAALRAAEIRVMLIKGAARTAVDQRSSADRMLSDVDALIHPDDWPRALELCNRNGWQSPLWPTLSPEIFPHHHAVMVRDATGGVIDLHHLALFMCRNAGDDDRLWTRARPASLRRIPLLVPSPADEVVLTVAHGLLHGPEPVADWVLDLASLIRSGAVAWDVVEEEVREREIDTFVASGLLFAVERLGMPVSTAVLDRMMARVREPFITDFRGFATSHAPRVPSVVDRTRAAAALRALRAMQRSASAATSGRPWALDRTVDPSSLLERAVPQPAFFPEIAVGQPVAAAVPTNFPPEAHLTLNVTLEITAPDDTPPPVLEIAAPGIVLKRWRAPRGVRQASVSVELPMALLTARRISAIEVAARQSRRPVPFVNATIAWIAVDDLMLRHPQIGELFDEAWYLARHREAGLSQAEPLREYLEAGWMEGRNPGPRFDGNAYLCRNPDIAAAEINPLLHYVRYGAGEGRTPEPVASDDRRSPRSCGDDDDEQLVSASGFFDIEFYRSDYPECSASDFNPLADFLRGGWRRGRSPGPGFDTDWYLRRNPDVAAADVNPLVHFLRYGQAEGRAPRGMDRRLVEAVSAALPGLIRAEPALARFAGRDLELVAHRQPHDHGPRGQPFSSFFNSLERPYDRIVFLPGLAFGGAELVAMLVAESVVRTYGRGSVLIVATDFDSAKARHWLPEGADLRVLPEFGPNLSSDERAHLVASIIQAIRPRSVMNVNSRACWDAFTTYGRPLAASTDLFAMLFARDYGEDGQAMGYADTHFRNCLANIKRVYADSESFPRELSALFGLTKTAQSKLRCVRPPAADFVPWKRRQIEDGKFSVLWAGRWCRSRRLDLLVEICRFAPDMRFHVFGMGTDAYSRMLNQAAARLDNLIVEGAYPSFRALPIEGFDVLLHTSSSDGMPRVLVSAAAAGMPVVASIVGGIGELINEDTGWPIEGKADVLSYVRALNVIRQAPAEADRRRSRLMERVAREHGWQAFLDGLAADSGFLAG